MPFDKKQSNEALQVATNTQDRINGVFIQNTQPDGFDIISIEEILEPNLIFMKLIQHPVKWTLLHHFMKEYYIAELYYACRKDEEYFPPYAESILDEQQIIYNKCIEYNQEYNWYLYDIIKQANIIDKIIHDAFLILFTDRKLMKTFNHLIQNVIVNLKKKDFPILKKDGQLKRHNYWYKWLKDALVNRENGRCAKCYSDLTGIIALEKNIHIDHIIPISKGGSNDTTNLQILCNDCNFKKSNNIVNLPNLNHVLWKL